MTNNIHLRNTLLLLVLTHAPLAAQNTSVNTRPDRGWLPTGRPAEPHGIEVLLSGPPKGDVLLDARYRVSRSGPN